MDITHVLVVPWWHTFIEIWIEAQSGMVLAPEEADDALGKAFGQLLESWAVNPKSIGHPVVYGQSCPCNYTVIICNIL